MGQVLTLLQLEVAEPLRSLAFVISIDIPALFIHFECLGFDHSYYIAWSVAALPPTTASHRRRHAPLRGTPYWKNLSAGIG